MGCSDSKPTPQQSNANGGKKSVAPASKTKEEDRMNRRDMPDLDNAVARRKSLAPDRRTVEAGRRSPSPVPKEVKEKETPDNASAPTSQSTDKSDLKPEPLKPEPEEGEKAKAEEKLSMASKPDSRTSGNDDKTNGPDDSFASKSDPSDAQGGSPRNVANESLKFSPRGRPDDSVKFTPPTESVKPVVPDASYDDAHAGYDLIDAYDYDGAFKKLMELVKRRDGGQLNLVALAGVSSLHGLGGDAWARVANTCSNEVTDEQKAGAEAWLRNRHLGKRLTPSCGSPASLLALVELHRMLDKEAPEDFVLQCIYLPTPHPLALLRQATDTLACLKKERTKDMDSLKLKEMEIEKKVLLRNFDSLSGPNTRVGAKAGKYLWMSYYKGADGYQRDLERAKLMLERAIHYEMGSVKEMEQYLAKVQEKLGNSRGAISDKSRDSGNLPRAARHGGISARGLSRRESNSSINGRQSPNSRSISPRRGSFTPRCTTPETPLGRQRSNSVISEVATTVAYMNGMEVCTVKEVGRVASESPRRGKVSSHDRDILADDDAPGPTTPRSARRRINERGHDIQEMIRRESVMADHQSLSTQGRSSPAPR
eukprot:TRINITY_DN15674_c1_g1_i1.p1 TRINITY_DN15674_c1_g1~~TRINITY_DN15674_c1_g1_i1.p1  ORF type:complete len:603 (+),score=199.22 TRINITY_DN15674_c1_g1_i1:22-1809(+)